ncbi:MAG: MarR family winged helix-turn-helix transcriptional regulator [Pseudomonadota bacterium]
MKQPSPARISLHQFWPYQVTVLADQIARYTMQHVRAVADFNQSQWRVLAAVADRPGSTAAQVTEITPMDKTLVSRAVSSLIASGHITRTLDTGDRRRSALALTELGQRCYQAIATRLNAALATQFGDDAELDTLLRLVKSTVAKMAAGDEKAVAKPPPQAPDSAA